MIKFGTNVDQELEEGQISGEFEEHPKPPSSLVIQSKPYTPPLPEQQSGSQEYVIERIKVDAKTLQPSRKKDPKAGKVNDKVGVNDPKQFGPPKQSDPIRTSSPTVVPHPSYYRPPVQPQYPLHPPFEQGNRYMNLPPQPFPPYQSYMRPPQFPPMMYPRQPEVDSYANSWGAIRRNHPRVVIRPEQKPPNFQNYQPLHQYPNYGGHQPIFQQHRQPINGQPVNQYQQQKQIDKRNKQREEMHKKQQKKRKIQSIKNKIISTIESCDLDIEENEQLLHLFKQSVLMQKPSQNILDIFENYMEKGQAVKQTIFSVLSLLKANKVLEKLKERKLLRRIVGEKKILRAQEIFDQVAKDPRKRRM